MQLARTRAFTSSKQARNVQCRAVKVDNRASSRRQALAGLSLATGLALLPNRAWALIPDEEDEEMLEKAKANRQKRLQAQKEVTRCVSLGAGRSSSSSSCTNQRRRCISSNLWFAPCSEFLREDGLKDKLLDSELVPVQKAVFQLAKSGVRWCRLAMRRDLQAAVVCTPLLCVWQSSDKYVGPTACSSRVRNLP
jgi:hypothetical protein